ncbi:MAG: DUF4333 domain-containing protein [Tomitella sp.]|nr:DUF4333 domain-containing protein [Tomitella sp.]
MRDPQDNTPPPAGEDDRRWQQNPEYAPPTQQIPPVSGQYGDTQQAYADYPQQSQNAYSEYPPQTVQGYPPQPGFGTHPGYRQPYPPHQGYGPYGNPTAYGDQAAYGNPSPYGDQPQQWAQPQDPAAGGHRAGPIIAGVAGLVVAVIAVFLVLGFVWPKFLVTSVLDTQAAETSIGNVLSDDFRIDGVGQVSCPDHIDVESGSSFVCNAVIAGQATSVTSTFTDDSGTYLVAQPTAS